MHTTKMVAAEADSKYDIWGKLGQPNLETLPTAAAATAQAESTAGLL
jgi:hypothetical protein